MSLERLDCIFSHLCDRDDRLRRLELPDGAETRQHCARNRERCRKEEPNDFEIAFGEHFLRSRGRRQLPFRHRLTRGFDRLHRRRGKVIALVHHR